MKGSRRLRLILNLLLVLGVGIAMPGAGTAEEPLDRAKRLNVEVIQLYQQGRYGEAIPRAREALALREQALGPTHPAVAESLHNLALLLQATGDYAGARPLYERALGIREQALGPTHPDVALTLNNLAKLLRTTGDYAGARPLYERSLRIREQALGPSHPNVVQSLNDLAGLLQTTGDYAGARPLYERARLGDLALSRASVELGDEVVGSLRRCLCSERALKDYVALMAAIARDPQRDPNAASPAATAFLVAEQRRGGAVQSALSRAGARAAAADAATASLAWHVQELRDRLAAGRKRVVAEYGRPAAQHDAALLASAQQQVVQLERELDEATGQLRAAFPRYAELASPDPIDVAGTQALLRADEALVSYLTLNDRLLIWVVRPGRALVYRDQELKSSALRILVQRMRQSADQSGNADLSAGRVMPFDVVGAHELYQHLLGLVAPELGGIKHLIVVPDDVLLPLPFGALLTKGEGEEFRRLAEFYAREARLGPRELREYGTLAWLTREYAITVLPSATSLRALRQVARVRGTEAEVFVGFGDPVFEGAGRERGGAMLATRGTSVNVAELRRLSRLPGTRDELLAVATALKVDPRTALYLDVRATKPNVMTLNQVGRLGRAQVLSFATHGLLAGEVLGLRQPALALTPPAQATEADDGLLALDDIVGLKLASTEWVVLSACNTGASDGSGEGLSGLARGFFFAGAPTLLVSHWSVEDRATQALMTKVFEGYSKGRTAPRAELVRQAMLELMSEAQGPTAYFAHPFAWAAFFLVGEGW
jgi:CHAT domain-containing protein